MALNHKSLRALIRRTGMTDEAFAASVGRSKGYISEIVNGKKTPSTRTIEQFAAQLDVPMSALLDDTDTYYNQPHSPHPTPGFSDSSVVQWQGKNPSETKEIFRLHRIRARHPTIYTTIIDLPAFAIAAGDLVLSDLGAAPSDGDLAIATISDDRRDRQSTTLVRAATPWYIFGSLGHAPMHRSENNSIGVVARVAAVVRLDP